VILKGAVALRLPGPVNDYAWILRETSFWAIVLVAVYTVYSGVRYAQLNWHVLHLGS
jgi:hypothetical protein